MMINDEIKVKYVGKDNPVKLRTGKIYSARVLQRGWYGIIDEMNDGEYAYPPEVFEIVENQGEIKQTENLF